MKQREPGEHGPAAGGRAWAGNAPVSELRAPGFHTTAQTPRPE